MLLTVAGVLLLCFAAALVVAKAARLTMDALGLDPWEILLWFGIAEWPHDELTPRRLAREGP